MLGMRGAAAVAGVLLSLSCLVAADEPQVWSGEDTEFVKEDFANCRLPENQDRITDNVWLTRDDNRGIFNATEEIGYRPDSPYGTEWAYGSAADWETLDFQGWRDWHGGNPPGTVGKDAVVHLIEPDLYIDIKFTAWTENANGGGFSYERSTEGTPGEKVWTGTPVTFTKDDYADIGLAANQDRITPEVWLTRLDRQGLFNVVRESGYDVEREASPPTGTEWAWGTTADLTNLVFAPWQTWNNSHPPGMVGKHAVLHLIAENVYIDIMFTAWTENDNGGGFSYERATPASPGETVWTGPLLTFTKDDYADWTDAANQDRISTGVWLTRQNKQGLFNIVEEPAYDTSSDLEFASPYNTRWAFGSAADWENLQFRSWEGWHGGNPQGAIGKDAVLHLIRENVYIDIKMLSFSGGGPAGGFSYERRTEGTPGERVWTGPKVTFTRADGVNWWEPANQDRISRWTWITRGSTQGLFNASFERYYNGSQLYTPAVEWAWGTAANWASLTFQDFRDFRRGNRGSAIVGKDAVLHLLDKDVYLDVKFLSWTQYWNGGGFSWERSTEGVPGEKVWTGPKVTFTKENDADYSVAANQDRITDNVWITRRDRAGLINITRQPGFETYWRYSPAETGSPRGTEWAFGTAAEADKLAFFPWYLLAKWSRQSQVPDMVGRHLVLHLIEEDVYLDLQFTYWSSGDQGGGFVYRRATEGVPGEKIWTGPTLTFIKANYADGGDPASQDRISDSVWLTRDLNRGPYNAAREYAYEEPIGEDATIEMTPPAGTEWAYGRAADWRNLEFKPWAAWHDWDPPSMVTRPAVLHLIKDDIYLDITFFGWTENDRGGGFAYKRASYKAPVAGVKAAGKVNFATAGRDSLKLKGELDLGGAFSPAGKEVTIDAGGVEASFTLDAKGKGTTEDGNGRISLKPNRKTGTWKYSLMLKNGSFAGAWEDAGMIDENIMIPVEWRILLTVDGSPFANTGSYTWKAKKGKSGSFK